MHRIYDAIAYLLPLSLRDPEASSMWDRELIDENLQTLTTASEALKAHTADEDREIQQLARSFDEVSNNAGKAFSNEWPTFAYFSMLEIVQHCVACHSRLPAASQDLFGQRLMARMDTRELPPEDVVKLFVAVRQFDAALKSIEKALLDRDLHPIEADYGSLLVDYLQIAIAAKRSPAKAQDFLKRYRARGDLPFYLERRIEIWSQALSKFSDQLSAEPDFNAAKAIFHAADGLSRGPGNRVRAVHDLMAASILRAYLSQPSHASAEEKGESYYMLGVVALRTLEPKSAVPEMEMLLAASIEADPDGLYAVDAYSLIEEYGYVHEDHLGAETSTQTLIDMDALRALIDQD